jgi:hypothetical protein
MTIPPERKTSAPLAVIPKPESCLTEKGILKDSVKPVVIWMGSRYPGCKHYSTLPDDLWDLHMNLGWFDRRFKIFADLSRVKAGQLESQEPDAVENFFSLTEEIEETLTTIPNPMAVFTISTPMLAESPWVDKFLSELVKYRQRATGTNDIITYKIILGGLGFRQEGPKDPQGYFTKTEMRAIELGGFYLHFSHDAPTACLQRLIEFMERILGDDLPGSDYPAYSPEEIAQIAYHIEQEDFNRDYPRLGAIPKYPIDSRTDRPTFSLK